MLGDPVQFPDPDLSAYARIPWPVDEQRRVEFFPNEFILVRSASILSPHIADYLRELDDGSHLAAVIPPTDRAGQVPAFQPLIQLASTKGALALQSTADGDPGPVLKEFFARHRFFGFLSYPDREGLRARFGADLAKGTFLNIESAITAQGIPKLFPKRLEHLHLTPSRAFIDPRLRGADWTVSPLNAEQVLVLAFHAIVHVRTAAKFPALLEIEELLEKRHSRRSGARGERRAPPPAEGGAEAEPAPAPDGAPKPRSEQPPPQRVLRLPKALEGVAINYGWFGAFEPPPA
jgi:hypothetical protein